MYQNKNFSIVLPAYNEGKSILKFIQDLNKLEIFDEIICVDNNSVDNTKAEILKTDAKYIFEKKQGFGAAVKRGLREAKSEYIFICEPDGSFDSKDVFNFLKNIQNFDLVFGSRSNKIKKFYLKYGNIFYAKFLSFLFKGPKLSDVGCSFRLIKKEIIELIHDKFIYNGPEFQVELTINLIRSNKKIIEIPVHYYDRIGKSKYTSNFYSSLKVALLMLKVILLKFLRII